MDMTRFIVGGKRPGLASILFLAGALAGSAAGVQAKPKVKSEVAKNVADYTVQKVAVLGAANTTGVHEADQMGTWMVQALAETEHCYIAPAERFALDAKRMDMEADYDRLLSTWEKKRTVDEEVLKKVLAATGYDALIGIEINDWKQMKLDPTQEGTSDTNIGVLVRMYAADGTVLWWASEKRTAHSPPYLPGFNLRSTGSGETRATSAGAVPEPPPYAQVGPDVAQNVASTFPDFKKMAKAREEKAAKNGGSGE
jgi:hypothetical protein